MKKILKLYKIVREPAFRAALVKGAAAAVEHQDLLRAFGNHDFQTIVDVGANRGQFALVARRCFPDGRIYAFEPLKEPASIFRRVFANDPRVVLHEIAVGPHTENMAMHVSQADDSSSLLPIAAMQSQLFPGTEEKEERKVTVRRLDAILCREDLAQPALLKIDVQGFEKDVLEGCKDLLPWFSYVYVECSFVELYTGQALAHEIISFLDECGFVLNGVYNLCHSNEGLAIQGDFLFKRKLRL